MLRVSKLTLRGFKSFGKPTVIDFPKGFTAIVGPNGSGKSNIIDSLCFVLGRLSSKSLRADRMSELIFSGSKTSKASTRAEVVMKFDNADRDLPIDTSSVELTREITKEGNSNYYLNGKKTTRQQIVDILGKAQINPNGHNIILQGDVAEIVDMSSAERREILDGISGISDYESKKQRALGELQKVENKIDEATAVCREREKHLEGIEKERDNALRYQKVSKELKERKAELFNVKINKTDTELSKIKTEIQEQEKKREDIQKELDEKEKTNRQLEQEIHDIDEELQKKGEKQRAEINKQTQDCGIKITRIEKDLESSTIEFKKIETNLDESQKKEKELLEKQTRINAHIQALETEDNGMEQELAEKQKELKKLQDKAIGADQEKTRQLDKALEQHSRAVQKLHALEKEQETNSEFIRVKKGQLEELQEKKNTSGQESVSIESEEKTLRSELEGLLSRTNEITGQISELDKQRTNLGIEVRKLEHEGSLKRRELSKMESERSAQKDHAGFGEAVKEIMSLRDTGVQGIYGTIAELGKVKEEYSLALKTAAGSRVQNIVVDNEDTAIRCINHLKKEKKGRATFLPLNRLKTREINQPPKEAIGLAIDLISFDARYRPAFEHVFTGTIVVDSLETAKRTGIGKRRTVTLEGDLVETSGAMSGGHHHKGAGRGFSIKELDDAFERISKEMSSLEMQKEMKEKEHMETKEKLFSLQDEHSAQKGEAEKTKKVLEGLQIKLSSLKGISGNVERIAAEIDEAENKQKEVSKRIQEAREEESSAKRASDEIMQKTKDSNTEELTSLLENSDIEVKKLEKKRNELRTGIRLGRSELEQVILIGLEGSKMLVKKMASERLKLEENDKNSQEELSKLKQRLEELKEEEKKYTANFRELLKKKQAAQKEIDKIREKTSKKQLKINEIQRVITERGIEQAKIEQRLADIQLESKDYQEIKVEITHSEKELEKLQIRLEKELEKIGPVNMLALDSFDKIKEDYESLKKKLLKLEEEKQTVLDFMMEVEKNKKDTFMGTFLKISEEFEITFAKLSPGGEAHLVLENPEEIFSAGMLIKAKPKGKELSNIEQMSGGEKTITALAFIFAIQRSHPAPFYVLDEVDAALDTANSNMLGKMVRELSNDGTAQFIVISHNESVFSQADQLYGVTMADVGSQIVGVDMK